MRNDDPEYVRDLERSNRAMENEIKYLTLEIDHKDRIIADMAEQLCPVYGRAVDYGRCVMNQQSKLIDVLGMDRMIRRAYESATSTDKEQTKKWHDAEVNTALKKGKRNAD